VSGAYRVTWRDSEALNGSWQKIADVRADKSRAAIVTYGHILERDSTRVIVAASVHAHEATGIIIIPAGCIEKVERATRWTRVRTRKVRR
jgi:hypothetical protein